MHVCSVSRKIKTNCWLDLLIKLGVWVKISHGFFVCCYHFIQETATGERDANTILADFVKSLYSTSPLLSKHQAQMPKEKVCEHRLSTRVCVCACVRACVRAGGRACVRVWMCVWVMTEEIKAPDSSVRPVKHAYE